MTYTLQSDRYNRQWKNQKTAETFTGEYNDELLRSLYDQQNYRYRVLDSDGHIVWSSRTILTDEDDIHLIDWRKLSHGNQLNAIIAHELKWEYLYVDGYHEQLIGYRKFGQRDVLVPDYSGDDARQLLKPFLSWRIEFEKGQGFRCVIGDFVPTITSEDENLAIAYAWLERRSALIEKADSDDTP